MPLVTTPLLRHPHVIVPFCRDNKMSNSRPLDALTVTDARLAHIANLQLLAWEFEVSRRVVE